MSHFREAWSRLNRGKAEVFLRFSHPKQQNLQVNQDLVASLNDAADKVHEVIGPEMRWMR